MSPATVQTLQIGDVVTFGSVPRKVRAIHPKAAKIKPGQRVGFVYFAILRRSWTNRPYTVYLAHELHAKHIRLVARGVRLRSTKFERLVQQEIESRSGSERFIGANEMVGLVT